MSQSVSELLTNSFVLFTVKHVPVRLAYSSLALYGLMLILTSSLPGTAWLAAALLIFGYFFIVNATVLMHEFGHGIASEMLGGKIDHILIYPLGGVCYHFQPPYNTVSQKLSNDLKITFAGPATHLLLGGILLSAIRTAFDPKVCSNWDLINPLESKCWYIPTESLLQASGHSDLSTHLLLALLAILFFWLRLNVSLFFFNVFFPLYPMDSSKLLAAGLQYYFNVPVKKAAWIMVITSFAAYAFVLTSGRMGSVVILTGIGISGFYETVKMLRLLQKNEIHKHPLFEHASDIDSFRGRWRGSPNQTA
jgi:hypothetical protein